MSGLPLWTVCAIAFAGLFGLALLVLFGPGVRAREAAEKARIAELRRYRLLEAYQDSTPTPVVSAAAERAVATRALAYVDRVVRARGRRDGLVEELERAGLRMRPEEWAAIQLAAVVTPAALGVVVAGTVLAAPVGGLLGWLGVRGFVRFRRKRRAAAFETVLPDALQLLAGALRTGYALNQAIGAVVREGVEPVAAEFGRALHEVRLGTDLDDALDATARRMSSDDLALVVMAIRTSREVGGNLAEVLQTTVATMRERSQLRGQVKVLSAEGRLSAKVLVALPVLMTGYLFLFNRPYLRPLYTTTVGIALAVVGVVLLSAGSLWLSRLTKIEV